MLCLSLAFLYGFTDVKLSDIESAIIEQDFDKSLKLAQRFIIGNPNENERNEARYYLGLSQLYLGNYTQARLSFEEVIDHKPTGSLFDRASLGIIDSYTIEGDYQEALRRSMRLLDNKQSSEFITLIYLKIARANLKLAHWDVAREYLNKIIRQYPHSLEFHTAKQLMEEEQYFSVQIGSFLNQERAENFIENLNQQGEYAYIVETVDRMGRTFYRVRTGRFSRLEEAKDMKKRLSNLGYPTRIYP